MPGRTLGRQAGPGRLLAAPLACWAVHAPLSCPQCGCRLRAPSICRCRSLQHSQVWSQQSGLVAYAGGCGALSSHTTPYCSLQRLLHRGLSCQTLTGTAQGAVKRELAKFVKPWLQHPVVLVTMCSIGSPGIRSCDRVQTDSSPMQVWSTAKSPGTFSGRGSLTLGARVGAATAFGPLRLPAVRPGRAALARPAKLLASCAQRDIRPL